jgi:hypothetical protein
MPNDLTTIDVTNLERCEHKGRVTFVDVGLALTEIRDKKLYRRDYGTFEAYCQKRWKFSRVRAYQLIRAAKLVSDLAALHENQTL